MAPPDFPQGMTLHSIGYAALKFPDLAPELPVPLTNQIGVLQRIRTGNDQDHMIAQIASQYLETLIAYQTSDDPILNDESSPQYYFSTTLCLLNFLTTNPDVCIRVAKHPTLLHSTISKLLSPTFETRMRDVDRSSPPPFPPPTFEDDFGTVLQFVSTILIYRDEITSLHPDINDLIPKLRAWKTAYKQSRTRTIANASERLITQIQGTNEIAQGVRAVQMQSLVCGYAACGKRGAEDLTTCSACKVQRYCSKEHQKKDWKYHKHLCKKGLVEPEAEA